MILPITEEIVTEWYFTHPRWANILRYYEKSAELVSINAESDKRYTSTYYDYENVRYVLLVQRAFRFYLILNEQDIPLYDLKYEQSILLKEPTIDMKITRPDSYPSVAVEIVPRRIVA